MSQAEAITKLHAACYRLSCLEGNDYAATEHPAALSDARSKYREACRECDRLGVDVAKELEGRGYLL